MLHDMTALPIKFNASNRYSKDSTSGFALVIVLSLMAFILLLLVSLSTFVQVEQHRATGNIRKLAAEQNALLAAFIALGDLQRLTGSDTRVTARADLLDAGLGSSTSQWTAVWRADTDRLAGFLVSGENPDPKALPVEAAVLATTRLSGSGALERVMAPLVRIEGAPGGRFAYWVGDEGSKATVAGIDEDTPEPPDAAPLKSVLAPGMAGFEFLMGSGSEEDYSKLFGLEDHRLAASTAFNELERLMSVQGLELLGGIPADVPLERFHDLTTFSRGVLSSTHPVFPGLRHDLSQAPDAAAVEPNLRLGSGYQAYADFNNYMIDPATDSVGGIVSEGRDMRRIYRPRAPVPSLADLNSGDSLPQDSPAKGTPVFSALPVLTQFNFWIYPYVLAENPSYYAPGKTVNSTQVPQDRDLGAIVESAGRLWNPHTSALDFRDAVIHVEIADFPDVGIAFRDLATGEQTNTSLEVGSILGNPLTFEFDLINHRRAAPTNQPSNNAISSGTAYDELVLGPGRVMPFVRHSFDVSRSVFRHSANHMYPNFHNGPDFAGARQVIVRLPGKAPPMTLIDPPPPIDHNPSDDWNPTPSQADVIDNLRILYDVPSTTLRARVYLRDVVSRDSNGNVVQTDAGQLIQEIELTFPDGDPARERAFERVLPAGAGGFLIGGSIGYDQAGFYVLGARDVGLAYSFKLREASPGPGAFFPADKWLNLDVRSSFGRSGFTDDDLYAETYANLDIWDPNFDNVLSWSLVDSSRTNSFAGLLARREFYSQPNPNNNDERSSRRDLYLFELPRRPQLSLGALQHLQVHGFPPYSIGNSWGRDAGAATDGASGVTFDIREDLNLVFDRYFLSGIVPGVREPGLGDPTLGKLPHSNLVFYNPWPALFPESSATDRDRHLLEAGANTAAFFLTEGAFNVNSTSEVAWAALLGANRFLDFEYVAPDPDLWDAAQNNADDRVMLPETDAYFTRFPQSLQEVGFNTVTLDPNENTNFNDYKTSRVVLAEDLGGGQFDTRPLRKLAAEIVRLLRERGQPFISLAEFFGPLDPSDPEAGSLLEQAIEAANINEPNLHRRSPAFLTQADILSVLAPVLQTRSDTFRIRSYGGVVDPITGDRSDVWCELIVQRVARPVDADPGVAAADYREAMKRATGPFGRAYEVIGFRWLDAEEVNAL